MVSNWNIIMVDTPIATYWQIVFSTEVLINFHIKIKFDCWTFLNISKIDLDYNAT